MKSILLFFYSTRFRLTLWYTLILALVLLIFSSIVFEVVKNDLENATYATLRSRLTQVAGTYNSQTGLLTQLPEGDTVATSITNNNLTERKLTDEVVLLLSPTGNVLQASQLLGGDQLSLLASATTNMWSSRDGQFLQLPKNSLPVTNNQAKVQVSEFGSLQSYNFPFGSFMFDQAALTNQQGQVLALLVVGIPSDASNWLGDLFSVLAIALPFMLLLASSGGYWLAGRAMRPVQAITRTARQISETDLHRRLKLKQRDELGELASTFDSMLDRLEAAFSRQRQFTADASHELRTPLSIVDLEASRALARELTSQEYQQSLTTIQQENRHMTRLVNDLLVLARADAGQNKIKHEKVDLSEVILDTVERLAPLAQQAGMVIKLAPLPELTILGDRVSLAQLLTNIVENALKYGSKHGTTVDITLQQRQERGHDWAVVSVSDDGPGIAKEHLPHLFERFYRVDQSRTHSQELLPDHEQPAGNGLGLSIAQWVAQAHGGEIRVRSAPGQGSTFDIFLPLLSTGSPLRENHPNTSTSHVKTGLKPRESTRMSQRMEYEDARRQGQPSHSAGYEESPDYNNYATGFGPYNAGQKLAWPTPAFQMPTAARRLALAIVSLALWVFTLFGLVGIAAATQAPPIVALYILMGLTLLAALIAIVNVVFNRRV